MFKSLRSQSANTNSKNKRTIFNSHNRKIKIINEDVDNMLDNTLMNNTITSDNNPSLNDTSVNITIDREATVESKLTKNS